MKVVTRGQALEVSARVATQVNWDAIDGDMLQMQLIGLTPKEFGERFTAFLKNGGRVIAGEPKVITIDRTTLFDPAAFIGNGWSIWKGPADGDGLTGEEEQDKRSLASIEVDLTKVSFETMLKEGEKTVVGEEKLKRLKDAGRIRLDAKVFQTLWEDYKQYGENSTLELLRRTQGARLIDFPGTELRSPDGDRYFLSLYWQAGEWDWSYDWLGSEWRAHYPSAVLAN